MNTQPKKIELKWYHIRRVVMTGEYCGGLIAGFGGGILIMVSVLRPSGWSLLEVIGLGLIPLGASIAMHAQGRYVSGCEEDDKGGEEGHDGRVESSRDRPWSGKMAD
jgi:hypothetical protein